jgi:hypothetical protein
VDSELWHDYVEFHREQIESWDIDPVYPVLRWIAKDADRESALWLTFLHVAYYHVGSALAVWDRHKYPVVPDDDLLRLPCGTERRGHRDPEKLRKHLTSLVARAPLSDFVDLAIAKTPLRSWSRMEILLQTIWGNGRWATYKTSEMLMKVNGLPLEATDMGHKNGSGSKHGLKLLFPNAPTGNTPRDIQILDRMSLDLVERLHAAGVEASLETAETSLCDFHSLLEGRYYVGHDIDAMLGQLRAVPSPLTEKAIQARYETLPHRYLGEVQGWETTDDERKRTYKKTGQLVFR